MAKKDSKKVKGQQKLREVMFPVEFNLFPRLDNNSAVELIIICNVQDK